MAACRSARRPPRGSRRAGRRRRGRGRPRVDHLLEPRPARARPTARRSSAAWPPSASGRRGPGDHGRPRRRGPGRPRARPSTTASAARRARRPSATSAWRSPTAVGLRRHHRLGRAGPGRRGGHRGVLDRWHRRRASRGRGHRRRVRRPRRHRPPPARHRRARAPRPSSTCPGRSSTWRRPACPCWVGATTGSRPSTPARRACPCPTGSSRPRSSLRCWRNRARPDTGVLLAVPIPEEAALDTAALDQVLVAALADAEASSITGAAVTPFVLGRIGEATAGSSVPANLALAENNCRVAAEVAVAVASGVGRGAIGVRPQVVVIGAGFGGLAAVKGLRDAPVDVTLVDANNFHTFQPLLYQVATAGLDVDDVAYPGPGHLPPPAQRDRPHGPRDRASTSTAGGSSSTGATPCPTTTSSSPPARCSADYGVPGRARARLPD